MTRPTEVAPGMIVPCPVELTIEMGPQSRLVFVSDLHLSGGGPASDFAADPQLVQLLTSLRDHPGQVVLVLGGDILDLLQARATVQAGQTPLDRAISAPDAARLGHALRELSIRPATTIVYLVGNHDARLAWDAAARQRVAREFGVHQIGLRLQVRVRTHLGARCGAGRAR